MQPKLLVVVEADHVWRYGCIAERDAVWLSSGCQGRLAPLALLDSA